MSGENEQAVAEINCVFVVRDYIVSELQGVVGKNYKCKDKSVHCGVLLSAKFASCWS